jgi:hypothetical protein
MTLPTACVFPATYFDFICLNRCNIGRSSLQSDVQLSALHKRSHTVEDNCPTTFDSFLYTGVLSAIGVTYFELIPRYRTNIRRRSPQTDVRGSKLPEPSHVLKVHCPKATDPFLRPDIPRAVGSRRLDY